MGVRGMRRILEPEDFMRRTIFSLLAFVAPACLSAAEPPKSDCRRSPAKPSRSPRPALRP